MTIQTKYNVGDVVTTKGGDTFTVKMIEIDIELEEQIQIFYYHSDFGYEYFSEGELL